MALSDLLGTLQKYSNASPQNPPPTVDQDFQHVVQHAQAPELAGGLADAFRSDQTPPFGQMIGSLFGKSDGPQRAGILNQLLGSLGPNALSALPGGIAGLLGGGRSSTVTPEQAAQVPPDAVEQLAEHAQKQDPSIIDQASDFYAKHPTLVQGLGAASLALIMSRMSRR